jgi:hypothetical protein
MMAERGLTMSPRTPANRATIAQATLTLPLPPNLANGRGHWRKKHRERREYFAACDQRQGAGLVPAPPAVALAHAWITAVITHTHWSDDDNAMARLKWSVDWLKTRGYIADDSRKCLTWTGLPHQHITRQFEPGVQITLTVRPAPAGGPGGEVGE